MENLFGTDGVRGVFGEKINEKFVFDLAQSVALYMLKEGGKAKKRVLIARDTRPSFAQIQKALCSAFTQFGIDVVCAGVMPTPAVHFLVRSQNFDMAVMITASHNPAEYNGIKIVRERGYKLTDEQEQEITDIFYNLDRWTQNKKYEKGEVVENTSLIFEWADNLKKIAHCSFEGMKVALDCANGAGFFVAPYLLKEMGAEVFAINEQGDGALINHKSGSTYPEVISELTAQTGSDIGFSFDGDADRISVSFGDGVIVTGEELIYLCCTYLQNKELLRDDKMITTIVTNVGLEESLKQSGIQTLRVGVGGKNIQAKMLSDKVSFGAEDNGHIIWGDFNPCSDGLFTAIMLTKMLKEVGDLRSMLQNLKVFYQAKSNVSITESQKAKYLKGEAQAGIEKSEKELSGNGRVIVRPSGTEPLIRIIVESSDTELAERVKVKIEKLIQEL